MEGWALSSSSPRPHARTDLTLYTPVALNVYPSFLDSTLGLPRCLPSDSLTSPVESEALLPFPS